MMVVNCLPMSEKGVTMGRMFLYVVSVKITSYYRCSLFYVLNDKIWWTLINKQNMCYVVKCFFKVIHLIECLFQLFLYNPVKLFCYPLLYKARVSWLLLLAVVL